MIYFFEQQITKYNTEKKCGFSWTFSAPLTEEALYLQQIRPSQKKHLQAMFLQEKQPAFSVQNIYDPKTGLLINRFYIENFSLFILLPDQLGVNNYNEIIGGDTLESRSAKLMKIKSCIADLQPDFCDFLGSDLQLIKWEAYQKINFTPNNYLGYQINATVKRIKN